MADTYRTIASPCEGLYKEKMSRFLSFAHPVQTVDEAMAVVARYKKEYFDARHCCWAYVIGPDRAVFRSNDDGEPSGTAGKPILGQINSAGLTNIVVCVVRYFGGIKLGTSGLIVAYRAAAAEALNAAAVIEQIVTSRLTVEFPYELTGDAMRVARDEGAAIVSQDYMQDTCRLTLEIRLDGLERLKNKYRLIYGIRIPAADGQSQ